MYLFVAYLKRIFSQENIKKSSSKIAQNHQKYQGAFEDEHQSYLFSYPGLSFFFDIPKEHIGYCKQNEPDGAVPVQFPDHTSPLARRLVIFSGKSHRTAAIVTTAGQPIGYLEPVVVQVWPPPTSPLHF